MIAQTDLQAMMSCTEYERIRIIVGSLAKHNHQLKIFKKVNSMLNRKIIELFLIMVTLMEMSNSHINDIRSL